MRIDPHLIIMRYKVEDMKLKDFTKEQQALMKRGGVVYDVNDGYDYCIHKGRIFRTEHDNEQTFWEEVKK